MLTIPEHLPACPAPFSGRARTPRSRALPVYLRTLPVICMLLLARFLSSSSAYADPNPAAGAFPYPPTIFPPYLQNPAADGMTICFLAQATENIRVAWRPAGGSADKELAAKPLVIPGTAWVMWKTRLTGLKPGTAYQYKVHFRLHFKRQDRTTPTYSFRTLNPAANALRFIVFNDLHVQDKPLAALMRHIKPEDYAFSVLLGDCLEASRSEGPLFAAWREYVELLNGSEKPILFIRGNHDTRHQFANRLAYLFDLPNLNVKQAWGEDQWQFTLRAGPVWLLAMDTGEDDAGIHTDPRTAYKHPAFWNACRKRQAGWLKELLANNPGREATWRIFLSHIPLYNTNQWYCRTSRRLWGPLLPAAHLDLMLAGHDHQWKLLPRTKDGKRPWPVLIGGGPSMGQATAMLAAADKKRLTVKLVSTAGKVLTTFQAHR